MALQIQPFDGVIGAEVLGADLSQAFAEAEQQRLIDAWSKYSVLVFRDQMVTPEQFMRFSRYFGDLEIHVLEQYLHREHPEIFVVSNILEDGKNIGTPDAGRYNRRFDVAIRITLSFAWWGPGSEQDTDSPRGHVRITDSAFEIANRHTTDRHPVLQLLQSRTKSAHGPRHS